MSPTLIVALLALTTWIVFAFVVPVAFGAIHLLLGLGVTLLIRWWALRPAGGKQ